MDNLRSKVIVVISGSDIVLRGLGDILQHCRADEIILLHQTDELINIPI
jgi:hypothetical protein